MIFESAQKRTMTLVTGFVLMAALALGAAAMTAMPAYASDVAYNENVMITAKANNPSFGEATQKIDVTLTFSGDIDGDIDEADAFAYLTANVKIANRSINSVAYNRPITITSIDGNVIKFTVGSMKNSGMTANYSGEFYIGIDEDDETGFVDAMGGEPAETLIDNGINISKVSDAVASDASSSSATFQVDDRAQVRGMNHILITDTINNKETPIFQGTGTFSNGGITVHSHAFAMLLQADYASAIVSATKTTNADGQVVDISSIYSFTNNGNQFTITKNVANSSSSNIKVYVYDCDYLNQYKQAVGQIYEHELDENGNYVN